MSQKTKDALAEARKQLAAAVNKLQTAQANHDFDRMSPRQKRVQIAKDVLFGLKSKRLTAFPGTYFLTDAQMEPEKEFSEAIEGQRCDVCALGGLFVCAVDRMDDLKVYETNDGDPNQRKMHDYLAPIFDREQLMLIENAFERREINDSDDFGMAYDIYSGEYSKDTRLDKLRQRALVFNKGVASGRERMERIMRNIVRNGGVFKP